MLESWWKDHNATPHLKKNSQYMSASNELQWEQTYRNEVDSTLFGHTHNHSSQNYILQLEAKTLKPLLVQNPYFFK